MKWYKAKVHHVMRQFTVLDIGVLKILCIVFGVLLALVFPAFFDDLFWVLVGLIGVTFVYLIVKIFGFYWEDEKTNK